MLGISINLTKKEMKLHKMIGQRVALDLGQIGPSYLTIKRYDYHKKIVYLEYDNGHQIELSFKTFKSQGGFD